jgi:Zn finger protein HypA/HybF involved in hydrogenase expression
MNDRSKQQKEANKAKKTAREFQRELAKLNEEDAEIREAAKNAVCSECHTKCVIKEDPLMPFCPKCDKFVRNYHTK